MFKNSTQIKYDPSTLEGLYLITYSLGKSKAKNYNIVCPGCQLDMNAWTYHSSHFYSCSNNNRLIR